MAEPQRQTDEDPYDRSAAPQRPNLRALEGGKQGGDAPDGYQAPRAVPNQNPYDQDNSGEAATKPNLRVLEGGNNADSGRTSSRKPDSPRNLRSAEESTPSGLSSGGTASNTSGGNLYNAEGDNSAGLFGGVKRTKGKVDDFKSRVMKNKLVVSGLAGVGAGVIALMIIVSILAGAYKLADFAAHVAAFQFARNTTQMTEDTTAIDSEKFGLDSLLAKYSGTKGVQAYNYLQDKYTSTTGAASDLWSKLDNYRPDIVMQNFNNDGTFKLLTQTNKLGKTIVTGYSTDGVEAELRPTSLKTAFLDHTIPGYKFVTRDIPLSRQAAPDLNAALETGNVGPITSARVATLVRSDLDVSLISWNIGKYLGKPGDNANQDAKSADAAEQQLSFDFGEGSSPTAPAGAESAYTTAAQDVASEQQADANNPSVSTNPNQLSLDLDSALNKSFPLTAYTGLNGALIDIIKFLNPVYAVAAPVCLVYDSSIQKSQQPIDYQSQELEREGILLQVEASQEKDGTNVNGQAVGAATWKIGNNINTSNAELRANGEPVDTSDFVSTEASPSGQYSYSLADVLPSPLDSIAGTFGSICPTITNLWVAAGVGIAGLLADPGFGEGEDTLLGAIKAELADFIPSTAAKIRDNLSLSKGNIFSKALTATKFGVILGGTYGATLLAQNIVASDAGAVHSSLDTDQSYDNSVDDGTNIYANQVEQQQFYGAPLTDQNLQQATDQAQAQLVDNNRQQSAYKRYLALSNPNSLFSDLIMNASSYMNGSFFTSLLHLAGTLLDPLRTMGSILSPLLSKSSFAATPVTSANTYYGNVQFGFTPYEQSLIQNNPTYQPLPNQLYLDQSGQEANIAARYGVCFDGSESIGTMLANGDIQRTNDGDVIPNQGLCSPSNLGTNNQDTGCNITGSSQRGCDYTGCPNVTSPTTPTPTTPTNPSNMCGPQGKGFDDLVFRWRVAEGYNNTLEQLSEEQNVTSPTTPTPTTPTNPTGYENPFRDVTNLGTSRVDEGVDFTGSGPVFAIGDGQVVGPTTNSGWPGGTFIVYKLTAGPAAGKFVYMAENCNNIQVAAPDTVTSNTVLCDMVNAAPNIETGWANGSSIGDALAKPVYVELSSGDSYSTAYGQNFRELLTSIGVTTPSCYDFPGAPLSGGPLPSSWPTWVSTPATKSGSLSC